jgi:DNA (cytosine-5)-methyltransferase 1
MLETIRIVQPSFVVGENVAGLVSMDDGRTFDNILASLEDEGYTVESFILPAASVGAWHRRDRVWIVANDASRVVRTHQTKKDQRQRKKHREGVEPAITNDYGFNGDVSGFCTSEIPQQQKTRIRKDNANGFSEGLQIASRTKFTGIQRKNESSPGSELGGGTAEGRLYWKAEPGMDRMVHGLPNRVDRIKALGNAIVPQVVYEIYKAIEETFMT